ncbi:AAA domain-containing protein [Nocardia australiensis]|uniref:AAA domain-containing protein n=1 Tax=Nocardia australiensis TaxID=2887191 RepID=UPI001D1521C1|nr:bifunctional RecB family nuclease/DEAD/DEAH box helicase [Nocardia australiensis]
MFGDRVVCTAVDLVRAARCEFALLRALDTELGMIAPMADARSGPVSRPGVRHDDSRERRLADLRARFGAAMVEIHCDARESDEPSTRIAALHAAHAETVAALRSGVQVVGGATFFDGRFACSADFLVRAGHRVRYTVHGTASGPDDHVGAALELAACAEALDADGALTAPTVRLHHGARGTAHALTNLLPVYLARRSRVESMLDDKLSELLPVQWGDPRYLACGHCATCTDAIATARDLLLVAGMPRTARARLREAGVATIDRLATTASTVPGLPPRTFDVLRKQAEIQLRREDSGQPAHHLVDAIALGALPPPSPGDLSLTFDAGQAGRPVGIEIGGPGTVHLSLRLEPGDDAGQRHALEQVLGYFQQRRRMYPEMHIYHYSSGVRSALLRWTGAHGIGEEAADALLHAGVLVDLYPTVRNALLIGEQSYRLDMLARLLPGAAHSSTTERDCVTVLRLRDWLVDRAAEQRIDPQAVTLERASSWCLVTGPGELDAGPQARPSSIEAALAEYAAAHDEPHHPAALMAAALGYHRRERQPLWWAHADRLSHPVDEWPDAPGVLVADWGTVDTKWHRSPDRATMRRYLTLTGRIGVGWGTEAGVRTAGGAGPNTAGAVAAKTVLAPGTTVYTFYDRPVAAGMVTAVGRRATAVATVLGCSVDADFDDAVRLEELLSDGCEPYDELPTAIAPGLPAWDETTETAVEFVAQELLMALPEIPSGAAFDILARRRPRLLRSGTLPEVHGDHAAAITKAVRELDHSYLAVQGPSGTGKLSTAARAIERLVTRHKWRIGIVAQAHSTVENLLDLIVEIGVLPELVAKKDVAAVAPEWAVIDGSRYARFLDNAVNGCVIGGAPADFANDELISHERLDLLVIADAGSFPLAETVAVAVSARNLLLLGDPAPPTTRSAHPEPVGESVLGWLTEGRNTLPTERGYFLDRTWRMHPRVCEPISRLYYDSRLRANETVTLARQLDGVPPGVDTVLVSHTGNSLESPAEAREVVRRVRALLGLPWTIGALTRRLHPHDIFVVAPYSAQVGLIRTLLARAKIEDVLVGTADRFRGREAAVVLLSMTTSSPADAPYGMPFLLSRSLIQATLCRAMWKAIIIRSPLLTEYLPAAPEDLPDLARFLRLG